MLKKNLDFNIYKEALIKELKALLDKFATSAGNKGIYAAALLGDYESGLVTLCINNEQFYNEKMSGAFSSENATGLFGARYNPVEFQFTIPANNSHDVSLFLESYISVTSGLLDNDLDLNSVYESLKEVVSETLLKLRAQLSILDTTTDFMCFHSFVDDDYQTRFNNIKESVTPDFFNSCFPEVVTVKQLIRGINKRSEESRSKAWFDIILSNFLSTKTEEAKIFYQELDVDFAREELRAINASKIVPRAFEILKQYIFLPDRFDRGSVEFEKFGAITSAGNIAFEMLEIIKEFGTPVQRIELELQQIYKELLNLENTDKNPLRVDGLMLLARCFHHLFPRRYPSPIVCEHTNKLLNSANYTL